MIKLTIFRFLFFVFMFSCCFKNMVIAADAKKTPIIEKKIESHLHQEKVKERDGIKYLEESKERVPKFYYTYLERDHSFNEKITHLGAIYALGWAFYPITQSETFREKGSWSNYKNNFGKIVFDQDEPFWNWFVHPISGSQLFLFYRANSYSRIDSLAMAFLSSTLFEFTTEIYTERASVQDLYQTPIIGSILGVGIENLSLYLLNTGNFLGKCLGHFINPATLFWFYEGRVRIDPEVSFKKKGRNGLYLTVDF